ncbi:ABC transporter permease subunit [Pantoea coffeiphila]|uniref:Phosphate ABC transporter permease n=1 Tax=Pantoea coffeiphila TaxID=1465635 RepID=A0A2S9IB17_9GAMM|nr:ABC transporter permease subunit [Pantoea coffeiphila]PRD14968.1 phosphate ABC transporter permease [Pantoea coffeiphila]
MENRPGMIDNPIPVHDNARSRRFADRLTRRVVTACGVAILLVMLLLFFWLIWVVIPLFSAPGFQNVGETKLDSHSQSVALGTDKVQRWGWRIDQDGRGQFISLEAQNATLPQPTSDQRSQPQSEPTLQLQPQTLLAGPVRAASSADNLTTLLLDNSGNMLLVRPDFSLPQKPEWSFPLGDIPVASGDAGAGQISVAQSAENRWVVALAGTDRITLWQLQPQQPAQNTNLTVSNVNQLLLSPDGGLLFTLSGSQLRVWTLGEGAPSLRDAVTLPRPAKSLALLSGGSSLLVADDRGISQWFDIASADGPHLRRIRDFDGARWQPLLFGEAHRRVFATLSPQGELKLYASKQQGAILTRQLSAGIQRAQFSPEGDGLLVEREGNWQHYRMQNPWPDISWRSLWQKVWYENYPEPDYVWQSTSANDYYQGKYSLVPMVVGTLKAAALAMLFATPLALAAAMYTAWFMSPRLRRWVKPAIEMMGALPSVVIGLIAGLWLAPRLGDKLSGVMLLPLMLAAVLLLCSWGRQKLPPRWRRRWLTEGREVVILLPLLLLTGLFCLWIVPMVEQAIWGQVWADRLSSGYQQRNLLVAGVAMGFALVPLIFTLAEDAIFSVPASQGQGSLALGATQWQTLTRVVLPGASSGIFAALMIGFGRALGETMIVLMATGNTPVTDGGLLQGLRSLAANVAVEMPEAAAGSAHYRILFLSALVLLVFTLVVNTIAEIVRQRLRQRYSQQEVQG